MSRWGLGSRSSVHISQPDEVRERAGARPYRDWKSPLDAALPQSRCQRILQGPASFQRAFGARHGAPGPLLGRDPLPRVRDIR
jgi:hypothetical protein